MKSVREFELEACDVGRWKFERHKCSPSPSLPHEIIEMILSRLPVKDLLRFRVVCKQWEATISNPAFAEIHLLHHKNTSSPNLLAWDNFLELHVVELRNNCIEFVSAIEFGLGRDSRTLCSCDGLYLRYSPMDKVVLPVKCVLCNPSCRTYRELYFPPSVDVLGITRSVRAMYYDPLMKDYKIVIADLCHYAVYSCRDNKWSDVKKMKGFLGDKCSKSVFVNGFIYWLAFKESFREVICFDCEDESFKTLPLPNLILNPDKYHFQLTSFGGQLCLLITEYKSGGRIKIMKKVSSGDEWRESKEECLCDYRPESYLELCELSENEILLQEVRKSFIPQDTRKSLFQMFYMVYDKRKNTLVEIHNNHMPRVHLPIPLPHVENLLLL